jgi:hypothetical protein
MPLLNGWGSTRILGRTLIGSVCSLLMFQVHEPLVYMYGRLEITMRLLRHAFPPRQDAVPSYRAQRKSTWHFSTPWSTGKGFAANRRMKRDPPCRRAGSQFGTVVQGFYEAHFSLSFF